MRFAELGLNNVYTYADYYKWDFEERVELINGQVFRMNPITYTVHQKVVGRIFMHLSVYAEHIQIEVYHAPFDVRIPRHSIEDQEVTTVLQPDVCVICDLNKLDARGCIGAPDIVVEVLSPGNNAKELKNKYEVYEEAGVQEYWVVSPQDLWVQVHALVNGKFESSPYLVPGDTLTTAILPGFSLSLSDIFKDIDPL